MSSASHDITTISFVKTFVVPGLLIFLIPFISFFFFWHAQSRFDDDARAEILKQIKADPNQTPEKKAQAVEFFEKVPVSRIISAPEFAPMFGESTQFDYATFRWMIRLSLLSLLIGVAVTALGGLCVLISLYSQQAQYIGLAVSWHVLRIYSAIQTAVLAILLVALSYWITALWTNSYYPQLILLVGIVAAGLVVAVVVMIFKKPDMTFAVEGVVIEKNPEMPLWEELNEVCAKVGTEPVDQVIAGIDDKFFVTELPVTVGENTYSGRTLFVSLSLLKHFHGNEAEAVLAHEMAHFSGQDTMYSNKMTPLLSRYDTYLASLYEGGVTRPIFYFMRSFRALFELSFGKLHRQREFRADKIAAEITSPQAVAGALLRIVAYSKYRSSVEKSLFDQEQELETANVLEQIDSGFHSYAVSFATDINMAELQTAHPFDSHPPLHKRFQALGIPLGSDNKLTLIEPVGDARWYYNFPDAEQLEREQWSDYENRFRDFHKQTLPYRYLPETDEERAVVVEVFPEISFTSFLKNKNKQIENLKIDFEKISLSSWDTPILYHQIIGCTLTEEGTLDIRYNGKVITTKTLALKIFGTLQQHKVLEAFQRYYSRYLSAAEYQKQKQASADNSEE